MATVDTLQLLLASVMRTRTIEREETVMLLNLVMNVGVFALGVLAEALTATHPVQDALYAQDALDAMPHYSPMALRYWLKLRYPWSEQIIRTLEHTMKLAIRFLMFYVCIMSDSRTPFCAMLLGSALGYIVFRRMQPPPITVTMPVTSLPPAYGPTPVFAMSNDFAMLMQPSEKQAMAETHVPMGSWQVCARPEDSA